jgi:hypothetical protein
MAVYQISNGVWTLLAGTNSGSDLPMAPGSTAGPVLVSNPGSIYYPNGATSVTLYPTNSYLICLSNNGGNLTDCNGNVGTIAQYRWTESASLWNSVLQPYYITDPLPNPFVNSTTSGTTWQAWITVQGAFSNTYIQPLGYITDPTAATAIGYGPEVVNDLHCMPSQVYSQLPSTGGVLQNFQTYYNPCNNSDWFHPHDVISNQQWCVFISGIDVRCI